MILILIKLQDFQSRQKKLDSNVNCQKDKEKE